MKNALTIKRESSRTSDSWIMNCRIHITSGYSDGWSIEHYKKELDKFLTLKKSWGTQLEIPFTEQKIPTDAVVIPSPKVMFKEKIVVN